MANQRLVLQIDTVTTGQQNLDALTQSLNKVVSISERTGKSLQQAGAGNPFAAYPSLIKQSVQDPLGAAEAAVTRLSSSFTALNPVLGGVVGSVVAIGTASFLATKSLADLAVQTQALSLKTGLTTKEVGAFSFAAKAAGGDVSMFQTAMRKLSEGLVNGGEDGKKAAAALAELGVHTRNLDGSIRPTAQIFEEFGTQLANIESPAKRAQLVVAAFGRSGIELIPTLLSLNQHVKEFQQLGGGISEAETAKLLAYQEQLSQIDAKWDILVRKAKEGIAGTFTLNFVSGTLDFLSGNGSKAGLPSRPSSFMTLPGDPGYTGGGISLHGSTQQESYNSLIYGNLVDPGSQLGIRPFIPGVPNDWATHAAAVKNSISGGDLIGKRIISGASSAPDAVAARIAELTEDRHNLVSASAPGQGVGEAQQRLNEAKLASIDAELAALKARQKTAEEVLSQANALKKQADDITYGDFPFTKVMRGLLGANKNPGSATFGDALAVGSKALNDKIFEASNLPLTLTGLAGAQYIGPAGQVESLRPRAHTLAPVATLSPGGELENENIRSATEILERRARAILKDLSEYRAGIRTGADSEMSSVRDLANRQSRIAAIGADPQDEPRVAREQFAIRSKAVDQERSILDSTQAAYATEAEKLELEKKRADLDREAQDNTLEYLSAVAAYQAKQKDAVKEIAGGLFDAATSRQPGALGGYIRGRIVNLGKDATEALAGHYIYPQLQKHLPGVLDPVGSLGKMLGWDKQKPDDPLKLAGVTLTGAGNKLDLAASKLLALSPSSGGGGGLASLPGGWDSAGGSGSGGFPVIGADGLPIGRGPSWAGNIGPGSYPGVSGDNEGELSGLDSLPLGNLGGSSRGLTSSSGNLGKVAAGVAAGVTGGLAAFQDFRRGGAAGALQGAGAIAGVASAVLPMISSTLSLAGPIGAIAGIGLSLLGGLFNSKQHRIDQINTELGKAQYTAPQALNVTESTAGTFADFGYKGDLRTSNLSPYPQVRDGFTWEQTHGWFGGPPTFYPVPGGQTSQFGGPVGSPAPPPPAPVVINVNAMDVKSFSDFAAKNHMAIGEAAARNLSDVHGRFARAVRRGSQFS